MRPHLLAAVLTILAGSTAIPCQKGGRVLCTTPFNDANQMLAAGSISADGSVLVQSGRSLDGSPAVLQVWDTERGVQLQAIESQRVVAIEVAPDGKSFVVALEQSTFTSWGVRRGRKLEKFSGHRDDVLDLAYSRDGKTVASSSADGTVRLWRARSGKPLGQFVTGSPCVRVVFSPSLERLGAITATGGIFVWDTDDKRLLLETEVAGGAGEAGLDFAPDAQSVYAMRGDGTLVQVSVEDGETLSTVDLSGKQPLTMFRVSPDGESVVTFTGIDPATQWRIDGKTRICNLLNHASVMADAQFTPDGRRLASFGVSGDGRVFVADKDDASLRITTDLETHWDRGTALVYAHGAPLLAVGTSSGDVSLWDTSKHRLQVHLPFLDHHVQSLAFSNDDAVLAGCASTGGLRLWDLSTNTVLADVDVPKSHCVGVATFASSFVSAWFDGVLRRVNPKTGEIEFASPTCGERISRLAVSETSGLAAIVCLDDTVRLLALPSAEEIGRFAIPVSQYWGTPITFDGTGEYLAVRSDDEVVVWQCSTKRKVLTERAPGIGTLHAVPNSTSIAVRARGSTEHWQLPSGRSAPLHADADLNAWIFAIAPDGKEAAAAVLDGTLRTFRIR